MGDAGPSTPPPASYSNVAGNEIEHETDGREVTVLVTGFGPFKAFPTNPSWLIASSLPTVLHAQKAPAPSSSSRPPLEYRIRLMVHPSPIRVAYATAATLIPNLISTYDPDYVVHIGMAGGRDHYTLETIAHRENYKIKDIDDRDGWREGEHAWKKENVPESLRVGWDEIDVLKRWEREVYDVEDALGLVDSTGSMISAFGVARGGGRKSVVKLSRDAGRFLCEFSLMESLSRRWLEASKEEKSADEMGVNLDSREGKVAFLHVPGGYTASDIARGKRVAEAAIRSIVASWEEGRRRHDNVEMEGRVEQGRWDGLVWKA